jgi:hypothetical protein
MLIKECVAVSFPLWRRVEKSSEFVWVLRVMESCSVEQNVCSSMLVVESVPSRRVVLPPDSCLNRGERCQKMLQLQHISCLCYSITLLFECVLGDHPACRRFSEC